MNTDTRTYSRKQFDALLLKIEEQKRSGTLDLSTEEDLSIAIMNLLSLEEHFFFTAEKTKKPEYFESLQQVRAMRQELLALMIQKSEGETWCIAKHLLAATMRLIEVGTKLLSSGKEAQARQMFDRAYKLYTLFWALRLKLVDVSGLKTAEGDKSWTLETIMNKLVDCCDEK